MPAFNVALHTRRGSGPTHDAWISDSPLSPITQPTWLALAHNCSPSTALSPSSFVARSGPSSVHRPPSSVFTSHSLLRFLSPEACLTVCLNPTDLSLACAAVPGTLHYLRLADATVKPLPLNPESFALAAGDAYLALTPGALRLADSPAIARFIHLRDYFNAEKLAAALLNHLAELATAQTLTEDVTVLVIEVR